MLFIRSFPAAAVLLFLLYTGIVVYVLVMLGRIANALSRVAVTLEHMRTEMANRRD
jgi:hypothetical protein